MASHKAGIENQLHRDCGGGEVFEAPEGDFYDSGENSPDRHWILPGITRLLHTPGEPLPAAPPPMPGPLLTPTRKGCREHRGRELGTPGAAHTPQQAWVWKGEGKERRETQSRLRTRKPHGPQHSFPRPPAAPLPGGRGGCPGGHNCRRVWPHRRQRGFALNFLLETLTIKCWRTCGLTATFCSPKVPSCLGRSGTQGPNVRGHLAIRQGTYREALGAIKVSSGGHERHRPELSGGNTGLHSGPGGHRWPQREPPGLCSCKGRARRAKGSNDKIQETKRKQLESDFKLRQAGKRARLVPPQGTPQAAPSTTRHELGRGQGRRAARSPWGSASRTHKLQTFPLSSRTFAHRSLWFAPFWPFPICPFPPSGLWLQRQEKQLQK